MTQLLPDRLQNLLTAHKLLMELCRRDPSLMRNIALNLGDLSAQTGVSEVDLQTFMLEIDNELQIERLRGELPTTAG